MTRRKSETCFLKLDQITFSYQKKQILRNVDLSLPPESFTSIVGESGSGKSTLLYILSGLLKPQKGRYSFQGRSIHKMGKFSIAKFRRENIGILFQDFRLLPFLNAEQNVKLPLYFLPERIDRSKSGKLLEELKISHRRKAYPRDLSGGEAQRTAIARAMILQPKLLLLDEPTGNLDRDTEKRIIDHLIKFRKKYKLTIVCVTHSDYVIQKAHEVWYLSKGRLSQKKKGSKR